MEYRSGTASTGYGTIITGSAIGGADISAGDPSVKFYDPKYDPTGFTEWKPISSVTNQIFNENGYMAFIRGDRSIRSAFDAAKPTTVRTKGNLLLYDQKVTLSANPFTSVGNPYASAIDVRKLLAKNPGGMNPFFYIWQATDNGQYGYGNYLTYSMVGNDFEVTPGGGVNNNVQSGQAFFVQTVGATQADLNFNEQMKETTSEYWMFRQQSPKATVSSLRTNLYGDNSKGSYLADGTFQEFSSDFNPGIDGKDARKLTNGGENLAILKGGYSLIIERTTNLTDKDTIFFKLSGTIKQKYHFEFVAKGLGNAELEGFLVDKYLKQQTSIRMEDTTLIVFNVDNEKASTATDRFMIVFKHAQAAVLPVIITSVEAVETAGDIKVKWHVINEKNMQQYEVERSFDGVNFVKQSAVVATNTGSSDYNWLDKNIMPGTYYYRIRSVDIKGKVSYTENVRVMIGNGKSLITIYPNPVKDGIINLHLINEPAGKYKIRLLNPLGQVITSKQITKGEGSSKETVKWDYRLSHGVYNLEVTRPDGSIHIIKVMY